uniref:Uncharacterized protein n=1 Tax=Kalanchoe fedtschenkoi TaxID=63787 RepID=A0A7N0V3Q7_KALFE
MAVALDMDDDLFFADLSRQISLLVNDDDQGPPLSFHHHSLAFQAFSTTMQSNARRPPLFPCQQSAWKTVESRGTGVFIPKSTNWRKKNKQRRLRSYDTAITYSTHLPADTNPENPHRPANGTVTQKGSK